ncbi:MAG: type II secretion system protein GspJ [Candidatus Binatia bacterium]
MTASARPSAPSLWLSPTRGERTKRVLVPTILKLSCNQPLTPKGFTLIEVLVAGAILSLVLAALYGAFSRTLTSKRLAEERVALSRAARIVLLRIGEDLQASFPFAPDNSRFISRTFRGGAFPEDTLSFVSLAHPPLTGAGAEGDLSEISYALVPDPQVPTYRQLVRRVRPDLAADREAAGDIYPLLVQVRGLRFRFFDGRNWREEWGRENTQNKLPRAVEVVLYLAAPSTGRRRAGDSGEAVVAFSTIVDLPLAKLQHAETS